MNQGAARSASNTQTRQLKSSVAIRPLVRPDEIDPAGLIRETTQPDRSQLRLVHDSDRGVQQPLPLVFRSPRPFVPSVVEAAPNPRLTARPNSAWQSEQPDDEFFERQPTGRDQLPEPQAWALRYGQAWVEALVGRRAAKQLSRWSTPRVLAELQRPDPGAHAPRSPRRPQSRSLQQRSAQVVVSRVRVDEPADGVAEVAAVVRTRGRSRALMLRLEGWDGRWVCTYAEIV